MRAWWKTVTTGVSVQVFLRNDFTDEVNADLLHRLLGHDCAPRSSRAARDFQITLPDPRSRCRQANDHLEKEDPQGSAAPLSRSPREVSRDAREAVRNLSWRGKLGSVLLLVALGGADVSGYFSEREQAVELRTLNARLQEAIGTPTTGPEQRRTIQSTRAALGLRGGQSITNYELLPSSGISGDSRPTEIGLVACPDESEPCRRTSQGAVVFTLAYARHHDRDDGEDLYDFVLTPTRDGRRIATKLKFVYKALPRARPSWGIQVDDIDRRPYVSESAIGVNDLGDTGLAEWFESQAEPEAVANLNVVGIDQGLVTERTKLLDREATDSLLTGSVVQAFNSEAGQTVRSGVEAAAQALATAGTAVLAFYDRHPGLAPLLASIGLLLGLAEVIVLRRSRNKVPDGETRGSS